MSDKDFDWRNRVQPVNLVIETDFSADEIREAQSKYGTAAEQLLRRGWSHREIIKRYPALTLAVLVGHAVAAQGAKAKVMSVTPTNALSQAVQPMQAQASAPVQPNPAQTVQESAQTEATQVDADLALDLIESGVTTQSAETVIAVIAAVRGGASINAAANASGINYRTAQRIVQGAAERRQRQLVAVG